MEISTTVRPQTKPTPIVDYFAGRFTYRTREAWQALVEAGQVSVNGEVATVETIVARDDVITTRIPDAVQPDANFDYHIIFEDRWLLVINKPANLRVHGRGPFIHANLIHHLRHVREPAVPEAELINRLDADTSGALLLAKDKETMKVMQLQFRQRQVRKRYWAWVHGLPQPAERVINRPLGQLPSLDGVYRFGSGSMAVNPKPAATRLRVLAASADGRLSKVELRPYTGRTHQLRVHLAELGHPLVGDWLYQLSDEGFLARHVASGVTEPDLGGLNRQALHCRAYEFLHPQTGELVAVQAPLPSDLLLLEERLKRKEEREDL